MILIGEQTGIIRNITVDLFPGGTKIAKIREDFYGTKRRVSTPFHTLAYILKMTTEIFYQSVVINTFRCSIEKVWFKGF